MPVYNSTYQHGSYVHAYDYISPWYDKFYPSWSNLYWGTEEEGWAELISLNDMIPGEYRRLNYDMLSVGGSWSKFAFSGECLTSVDRSRSWISWILPTGTITNIDFVFKIASAWSGRTVHYLEDGYINICKVDSLPTVTYSGDTQNDSAGYISAMNNYSSTDNVLATLHGPYVSTTTLTQFSVNLYSEDAEDMPLGGTTLRIMLDAPNPDDMPLNRMYHVGSAGIIPECASDTVLETHYPNMLGFPNTAYHKYAVYINVSYYRKYSYNKSFYVSGDIIEKLFGSCSCGTITKRGHKTTNKYL